MKKLNIITILFCLILFITACGPSSSKTDEGSTTATSVAEISTTATSVAETEASIGKQVWTTKNLDVIKYRNGDAIPQVQDKNAWAKLKTGAWCYYENKTAKGTTYGKLYNWFAVNDLRGLAPSGYHIPTDAEWTILTDNLGEEAGTKMKSKTGWDHDGNGTNTSGFAGLPGGYRNSDGNFYFIGAFGYWWSSSESNTHYALYRFLSYPNGIVLRLDNYGKQNGFSVRCLRD